MSFKEFVIIFSMIILGLIFDNFVSSKIGNFYLHTNFAYLVFSYWVFACPEKIGVLFSLFFGLIIDFISGSAIGFHAFMYLLFAYIIHIYAFSFRLFSYIQLAVFFGGSATFVTTINYLIEHTANYSYTNILIALVFHVVIWIPFYKFIRFARQLSTIG